MQNIITNFRLSFPVLQSDDLDVISTTPSPLPKFFIITWKYNPVSEDYDRELETDSPILGDFLEDKEPSGEGFIKGVKLCSPTKSTISKLKP